MDNDPTTIKVRAEQRAELEAARSAVAPTKRDIEALLREEFGSIAMRGFDSEYLGELLTELAENAASRATARMSNFRLKESQQSTGHLLSTVLTATLEGRI